MRKNGVNRELTEISGGVCAPSGFTACAVQFENLKNKKTENVGFIFGKRRFPSAYLGAQGANASACVKISEKHLESGNASTIIVHNGLAIAQGAEEDKAVETICRAGAKYFNIDRNDIIFASIGALGGKTFVEAFEQAFKDCAHKKLPVKKDSFAVATAINKNAPREVAFSFNIGDWICKIGAVFTNGEEGKLCLLTTDVKISSKMLKKALNHVANEYFYMTPTKCGDNPHDCICITASEEAQNWRIEDENADYDKFVYALASVMDIICRQMATQGKVEEKLCLCKVIGAKSKRSARQTAFSTLSLLRNSGFSVQNILRAVLSVDEMVNLEKLSVSVVGEDRTFVLYEDGASFSFIESTINQVFQAEKIEILINLQLGNYSATAFGGLADKE